MIRKHLLRVENKIIKGEYKFEEVMYSQQGESASVGIC